MTPKIIACCGPSGSGKTVLVKHLLGQLGLNLEFSISATSRNPRKGEINGKEYYFLSVEKFKMLIEEKAFVEHEEVYKNHFYGTLQTEIDRIWKNQKNIIFDIDIFGAMNLKKKFLDQCLTIFIAPPTLEILRERLEKRLTEDLDNLSMRLDRATFEMSKKNQFDKVIVNDNLHLAKQEIIAYTTDFLNNKS